MLKREAVENIGRSSRDVDDIAYLSLIEDGENAYLDVLVQE